MIIPLLHYKISIFRCFCASFYATVGLNKITGEKGESMKTNRVIESSVSLFSVLLVYALSFSLSLWREAARLYLVQHWGSVGFIIRMIIILIIMATSLMALNWFINQKMRPNVLVACILFITGCILLAAPFFDLRSMPTPFPAFLQHNYPGALLSYATIFISITGIIGLMRSLKNRNQKSYPGEPDKKFLKNNRALELALSFFAVLLILAIAYGLDLLRESTRTLIVGAFRFHLFIVSITAIHAFLMACFIALNWLINSKIRPKTVVSWIIFLSGGLLLVLPLIIEFITPITFFRDQWFRMSLLYMACAFITVIGGIGILRKVTKVAK